MAGKKNEMSFIPQLKAFLSKNGKIYTVRKYIMKEADVYVTNLGWCRRKPLGIVSEVSLKKYVIESGFNTIDEWLKMIKQFISDDGNWYLYEVTLLRKSDKCLY